MGYMLEIQNIHKTFHKGTINEKKALDGVNLRLDPGDFVTIIGGNGAGKSTTLNAIAGTWFVDEGKIIIDGADITNLPEHRRAAYLGRVFQDPMTGTAATMSHRGKHGHRRPARQKKRPALGHLQEGEGGVQEEAWRPRPGAGGAHLHRKWGFCPAGRGRRSPFSWRPCAGRRSCSLTSTRRRWIRRRPAKVLEISDRIIEENQLTALMVTHNMRDAIAHGNRLIMMHEGRIIYDVSRRGEAEPEGGGPDAQV